MKEKKPYQLINSYVDGKYFVSTAYRKASTAHEVWYFETIVWKWDNNTQKRGKMLEQRDSGLNQEFALINHFEIIKEILVL